MERIIFNDDNLTTKEINDSVMKSRAIIVNDNGELLLCKYANMYFLPGGRVDDERYLQSGLEVEIKEETGISLNLQDKVPFLLVQQCIKDYPKRDNQGFTNRLNQTYYFIIHSNKEVKQEETALTEEEKQGGFSVLRVHPNNIDKLLTQHTTDNPRSSFFTRELLAVIKEYKKTAIKDISNSKTVQVKELRSFSTGEYVFTETENDNQFLFYREDGQTLGNVEREVMDMYQEYINMKMFSGELTEIVMNNIRLDIYDDGKYIRLTTFELGKEDSLKQSRDIRKLIKSIFGKKSKQ